jgi:hypothetical protein
MDDMPQGQDAASPPAPGAAPAAPEAGTEGKECVLCGEAIPVFADRCRHCGGFLPIAEGRAFPQHFFFIVCCLALFIGTLLPWEGMWWDSYGSRSVAGAFLLVFSGYGLVAAYFNVFHRRMIVWPVILAAVDGTFAGWKRVLAIANSSYAKEIDWGTDAAEKKRALFEFLHLFGPGLWLVVVFSSLFWFVFVLSVIRGGQAAAARKEAEKAARLAKRKG